jgi:hypothetical protein
MSIFNINSLAKAKFMSTSSNIFVLNGSINKKR